MHELTKGTYGSFLVHGTLMAACFLLSYCIRSPARTSPTIGLSLGTGMGGGRSGARAGGRSGPRDVSDLSRQPATAVTKAPAAQAKARPAGQTSPTGPASLGVKTDTKNETMTERLERIRRSARPAPTTAADRQKRKTPPAKKLDPTEIAARLSAGVHSADGAVSGPGSADGKSADPRGKGSGNSDGPISVGNSGRGNGAGDGEGDGEGSGGGGKDPFLAAISAALHEAWETPSRAEIGSGDRRVAVKITLRADGRVTAFQVTQASGNPALDQSVEQMLRQLRTLPAPADYGGREAARVIEVVFRAT